MNIYLLLALIGGALELIGFLFGIANLYRASKFRNDFSVTLPRHFIAVGICGLGSMILLGDLVAYLIHRFA